METIKEGAQLNCVFTKMYPRVDRSWKLEFGTLELIPDEVKVLYQMVQSQVMLVIAPALEDVGKIHEIKGIENGITQSQRLRNKIYSRWEHEGRKGDFKSYYDTRMSAIIEREEIKEGSD